MGLRYCRENRMFWLWVAGILFMLGLAALATLIVLIIWNA